MNDNKTATLYVSSVAKDGFKPTMGSDKQTYWYRFDGGEGHGAFHGKKHENKVDFNVDLEAEKDFRMHDVKFDKTFGQLAFDKQKSNHKRSVISDANTGELEAYYLVVVARASADGDVLIPCDPMIKNDPR